MKIMKSFLHAGRGILYGYRTQVNFRIHIFGFIFLLVSAYYFQFETWELIVCLIVSALVFSAELMNTAMESVVDLCSPEYNELAKIAKDCAAASVLILAAASVCIWIIIVLGKYPLP